MKNLIRLKIFSLLVLLLGACSSDDCTKTIVVQPEQVINTPGGSVFYPERTQEIPCDAPEPEVAGIVSGPDSIENFSYEVISFNFTPDTGNNTSRLQFEIKLENANNFAVEGVPILTFLMGDLEISGNYSAYATSPCYEIGANSSCLLVYDQEQSLDLGVFASMELVSVKYYVAN